MGRRVGLMGEGQNSVRAEQVGLDGSIEGAVERHGRGAVNDRVASGD